MAGFNEINDGLVEFRSSFSGIEIRSLFCLIRFGFRLFNDRIWQNLKLGKIKRRLLLFLSFFLFFGQAFFLGLFGLCRIRIRRATATGRGNKRRSLRQSLEKAVLSDRRPQVGTASSEGPVKCVDSLDRLSFD